MGSVKKYLSNATPTTEKMTDEMKLSSRDRRTTTTRRPKPAVLSSRSRKTQIALTAPSATQPPIHNVARYRKLLFSCEETVARTERLPLAPLRQPLASGLATIVDVSDFSVYPVLILSLRRL